MLPNDLTNYKILTHSNVDSSTAYLCKHPDTCSEYYLQNSETGTIDYVISETIADYAYDVTDDDEANAFIFDLSEEPVLSKERHIMSAYFVPQLAPYPEHYIDLANLYNDKIPMAIDPNVHHSLKHK